MNRSNSASICLSYLPSVLASVAHELFPPLVGRYFTTFSSVLSKFPVFFPHIKEDLPLASVALFGPSLSHHSHRLQIL